ncbi:MAG: hypothetical protein JWQ87_3340 [Candidatus Sulfotelmatobacter sp.]|nr:hypothetical protein [Candidatus Sulfotelmatobacter sp.]
MLRLSCSRSPKALALLIVLTHGLSVSATPKTHILAFGKWTTVQWNLDSAASSESEKTLPLKVRPLLIDAHVKEFTFGFPHDVTDRLFVVRRAFRVNDSLPQESAYPPHWRWQRGGWLLIDRVTGHISPINLPQFDAIYSAASWYRDYVAYCGVSDDGRKIFAVVAQITYRKPVLKKLLEGASNELKDAAADSACSIPTWQRNPSRVSFELSGAPKQTFAIRGHAVDVLPEDEEDQEAAK